MSDQDGVQLGHCPEWYSVLRAARYLGVAPWDLAVRPRIWQTWALEAEAADIAAHNHHNR